MTPCRILTQRTAYLKLPTGAVSLPFVSSLTKYHGTFSLVENPAKTGRTCIIGMFVLRPATKPFTIIRSVAGKDQISKRVYGDHDWVYNVKGIDGGRLISNHSTVDAYRLALQYGLSDAVIIGSNVLTTDGAASGYLWQPYAVCQWEHVRAAAPTLLESIGEQRREWQRLGFLSNREYPAQIAVTWSGEMKDAHHDFLADGIFHGSLPNGNPIEAYIITSEIGAHNIRKRAAQFNLQRRIEDMLIVLPPESPSSGYHNASTQPAQGPTMDLSLLPKLLLERLNIRIANHDGGRDVLRSFARAGALSQLNLTLCENQSVLDVLRTGQYLQGREDSADFTDPARLAPKLSYFFNHRHSGDLLPDTSPHGVPRHLELVEITQGVHDEVTVVTFRADKKFDF